MTGARRLLPLLLAASPGAALAQPPEIGQKAPELAADHWFRDKPWEHRTRAPEVTVVQLLGARFRLGREDLTLLQQRFAERARAICLVGDPLGELTALRERNLAYQGKWMDYAIASDDANLIYSEGYPPELHLSPRYVVIDVRGRMVWVGHMYETDEPLQHVVADVLVGRHDVALEVRTIALRRELARLSTKSDKPAIQGAIDRLRKLRPHDAASWIAQFDLLMMTVPQRRAAEDACVEQAVAALREHPLQLAIFVNRALYDLGGSTPHLARIADVLGEVARQAREVRALEWARFRSLVAAQRVDAARSSATRLVEMTKGIPSELRRVARALLAERHGVRFTSQALLAVELARLVNPENPDLEMIAFDAHARAGDDAEARAAVGRLIELASDDAHLLSSYESELATTTAIRKRFPDSIAALAAAAARGK